jgi:hypothetical protein
MEVKGILAVLGKDDTPLRTAKLGGRTVKRELDSGDL